MHSTPARIVGLILQGLHKLQLIREAKRVCPDVVVVLGEDLARFRDASKELYSFLRAYSWNGRVERLGFDEVAEPRFLYDEACWPLIRCCRFLWISRT